MSERHWRLFAEDILECIDILMEIWITDSDEVRC